MGFYPLDTRLVVTFESKTDKTHSLKLTEWGSPHSNGLKLAVGQPNSRLTL